MKIEKLKYIAENLIDTFNVAGQISIDLYNKGLKIQIKDDNNTLLVDIRDIRELWRDGTIPNSIHAPRGMLEFWVDPNSPYYREQFGSGKKIIFFCAGGLRSALAAFTVKKMGLEAVAHMEGGYAKWVESGGTIEPKEPKF